jgi:mannosyltransferase OCH1-like enzyme
MLIPKIIHLTCATTVPPMKYSSFFDRIKLLHPSWEINVWDDENALSVVRESFPELENIYVSYTTPIQRADIFRVLITYLKGGFYMDLDMLCFKSLDELCEYEMVLGIEKTLSQKDCIDHGHEYNVRIANYMFGSKPRHEFWMDFLNAAKRISKKTISYEIDVLETTGPGLLTNVYHEMKYRHENITLLANEERSCLRSCGPASCHFGDFAAHFHMGSWRWESIDKKKSGL